MELQVRDSSIEQPIRTITESVFRQKNMFVGLLVLVMICVAAVTLTAKPQYPSRMKILLENNRSNAVITSDRGSSSSQAEITGQQINSELEILGSEDVLTAVADPNWPTLTQAQKTPDAVKKHEQAVGQLRGGLIIDPVKGSNVIDVTYTSDSPSKATTTLERYSAAYVAKRKRLTRPSGASEFFTFEADRYEKEWHRANAALVDFQQGQNMVSEQDEQLALSKEIAEYEDRMHENEANLAAMGQRLSRASEAQSTVPERQEGSIHTILNQASTEQMRTLIVQLRNRRTELLTRYTEDDPLVVELNREMADTTASMNEARVQKGTEDSTDINPVWQQVMSTIVQGRIEQNALRGRQSSLQNSVASLRKHLSHLQSVDVRFNALQEEAEQARNNFKLFSEKRDQAQIEDAMDDKQLTNVAIVQVPTSAFRPVSPKTRTNLLLGGITAVFVALGSVYFVESTRSTVSTPRELERSSRYPVLATCHFMPHSRSSIGPGDPEDGDTSLPHRSFGARYAPEATGTSNAARV